MPSPIDECLTSSYDIDAQRAYTQRGVELLDSALDKFNRGLIALGMDELVLGLRRLRDDDESCWRLFVQEECRSHPIALTLLQDPLTARSLLKPRGYAGDPEMLDFIFSPDRVPPGTSSIGASIFGYTTDGPAPRSVRARAAMVARIIDEMAAHKPLRVLAIMGGHLWERQLMRDLRFTIDDLRLERAERNNFQVSSIYSDKNPQDSTLQSSIVNRKSSIDKYLAFDQDARTLAAIEGAHGDAVTTYQGTLSSLFRGRSVFRNFDLLYSPICDNLTDATASRFIATLFNALAPGGRMVISNFAPQLVDAGYMEAFMDWNLIYRDEKGMEGVSEILPEDRIAKRETYRDPHGNIVFLDIERI
jgi:hypothetical protein